MVGIFAGVSARSFRFTKAWLVSNGCGGTVPLREEHTAAATVAPVQAGIAGEATSTACSDGSRAVAHTNGGVGGGAVA